MIAAIGQMRTAPLDRPSDNMAEALRLAEEAAAGGARLLVLPEGCLTGNALRDPARQAVLPEDPAALGFDGETWWPGNGYAVSAKGEILAWVKGENRPDRMVSRLSYADIG